MRGYIMGVLLCLGAQSASAATEVTFNTQTYETQNELEKIQFMAAIQSGAVVVSSNKNQGAYANGDAYYLSGNLGSSWTRLEWDRYYDIAKWLVRSHFRVIMNPVATAADVREAIQNPTSTVIIWSSHGDENGDVYDATGSILPENTFTAGVSTSLRQIVLSNCYGEMTVQHYPFPPNVNVKHWFGLTTSDDLFHYLLSDEWNRDLGFH